jgi:hypothetical protein
MCFQKKCPHNFKQNILPLTQRGVFAACIALITVVNLASRTKVEVAKLIIIAQYPHSLELELSPVRQELRRYVVGEEYTEN